MLFDFFPDFVEKKFIYCTKIEFFRFWSFRILKKTNFKMRIRSSTDQTLEKRDALNRERYFSCPGLCRRCYSVSKSEYISHFEIRFLQNLKTSKSEKFFNLFESKFIFVSTVIGVRKFFGNERVIHIVDEHIEWIFGWYHHCNFGKYAQNEIGNDFRQLFVESMHKFLESFLHQQKLVNW